MLTAKTVVFIGPYDETCPPPPGASILELEQAERWAYADEWPKIDLPLAIDGFEIRTAPDAPREIKRIARHLKVRLHRPAGDDLVRLAERARLPRLAEALRTTPSEHPVSAQHLAAMARCAGEPTETVRLFLILEHL